MFYLLFYSSGLYLTFFYCYIILEGLKKTTFFFFKLRGKKRSTLLWKGKKMAEECRRESSTPSCSVVYFTHVFSCLWPKCDSQVVTGHVGDRWELTECLEIYSGPNVFKSVCCKALAHQIRCWIISSGFDRIKGVCVRLVRVYRGRKKEKLSRKKTSGAQKSECKMSRAKKSHRRISFLVFVRSVIRFRWWEPCTAAGSKTFNFKISLFHITF